MSTGASIVVKKPKDEIIASINKLKKKIQNGYFELDEIEEIRREIDRLSLTAYNKLLEIEEEEKKDMLDADIYVCKLCGKEFTSKRSINSHIITHHHMKPKEDYIQRIKFPEAE